VLGELLPVVGGHHQQRGVEEPPLAQALEEEAEVAVPVQHLLVVGGGQLVDIVLVVGDRGRQAEVLREAELLERRAGFQRPVVAPVDEAPALRGRSVVGVVGVEVVDVCEPLLSLRLVDEGQKRAVDVLGARLGQLAEELEALVEAAETGDEPVGGDANRGQAMLLHDLGE
jgi:hypothetical protein